MLQLRIEFDPIWSVLTCLLLTVGMAVLVWYGYRLTSGLSRGRRLTLLGIRLLLVLLLGISMIRPQLQWISPDGEHAEIWILGDQSRSMSIPDGPGGITRRQSLQQAIESIQGELTSLADDVKISYFDFDSTLHPVDEFGEQTPGAQTAIGSILQDAAQRHVQSPLTAVFLLSDGAERSVPPRDLSPRIAARELAELGVSIYGIPVGQTAATDLASDVAIEEIQVDPIVFVKKRVPVRVNVRWDGAPDQTLNVKLLLEDRSQLKARQSGPMNPIPNSEFDKTTAQIQTRLASGSETVEMYFTPDVVGEYKLGVEVSAVEGEVQQRNNRRETLITVRQGGLRVAYFDIFRTEVKSVRQLNSSEKVQVDFQLMRSGSFGDQNVVDPKWFEKGRYDVFVIGDVPAEQFGADNLSLLARRVEEGAGLLMLGGYHTYGPGGYASSALREYIPVLMRPGDLQPAGVFNEQFQLQDEIRFLPTDAGNRHYVTRIDGTLGNGRAWEQLPPLQGATRIQPKSDFVEVLAETETQIPLIISAETGRGRVMCFAFDQTYLWAQSGFSEVHRRFWRQAVLWLAHKDLDTDQPVWALVTPKSVDPGGRVTIEYGARDDEGAPRLDCEFKVIVSQSAGKEQSVTGVDTEIGKIATFDQTVESGDYFIEVTALANGQAVALPITSRFLVHDRDLELDHPVVDRGLLQEIVNEAGLTTDSQIVTPEDLVQFLREYLERKPWEQDDEAVKSVNLWDGWPILLIFVALLSVEWTLRKQGGLV